MTYGTLNSIQEKRLRREVITNFKTYEEAETICSTAFQASKSYQTCQEYVTDLSNTSLVNCISDVMVWFFCQLIFFPISLRKKFKILQRTTMLLIWSFITRWLGIATLHRSTSKLPWSNALFLLFWTQLFNRPNLM